MKITHNSQPFLNLKKKNLFINKQKENNFTLLHAAGILNSVFVYTTQNNNSKSEEHGGTGFGQQIYPSPNKNNLSNFLKTILHF